MDLLFGALRRFPSFRNDINDHFPCRRSNLPPRNRLHKSRPHHYPPLSLDQYGNFPLVCHFHVIWERKKRPCGIFPCPIGEYCNLYRCDGDLE